MSSPLEDAFAHAAWAMDRLYEACQALSPEHLASPVPGTGKSILETLRHLAGSESFELFVCLEDWPAYESADDLDLEALRALAANNAEGWMRLVSGELNSQAIKREVDPDDGYTRDAPLGLRIVAALEHGYDHRAQLCTALSLLGLQPPDLTVWRYGTDTRQMTEAYPTVE